MLDFLKSFSKIDLLKFFVTTERGCTLEQQVLNAIDLAISYYMAEQKITREQMAQLMGMSANTLRWKREGKTDWTLSEVLRISDLTGKTIDELAGMTVTA